jgi:hypothetical protein
VGFITLIVAVAAGFMIASAARRKHDWEVLAGRRGPSLARHLVSLPPLPPPAETSAESWYGSDDRPGAAETPRTGGPDRAGAWQPPAHPDRRAAATGPGPQPDHSAQPITVPLMLYRG